MKKITGLTFLVYSLMPGVSFAALGTNTLIENNRDSTIAGFLGSIQNWLLGIVGGLAVLFIVYGGFLYITSGGNKEKTELAKKTLTYAIMGLVLTVLAGLILEVLTGGFLSSIFGNESL